MIGITKISSGRMGNRLFHYHFLRQVSKKTGVEYFHVKFPDFQYFEEMTGKSRPFFPLRKSVKLTSYDITSSSQSELLDFIIMESQKGRDIILQPPILGEAFFDYLFFDPNEFIKIKNQYKIPFKLAADQRLIIGLHFRGTDFSEWNERAALKFTYYRDALIYCLDYYKDINPAFMLFTDDPQYPAYQETISFLKSFPEIEFDLGDVSAKPICDFYQMSQCDVLISSPSTYAIFAGCLGKPKKIIHDKNWLDWAVQQNDLFWVKLVNSSNPYYSLWKAF
jgi:hypothetical protein